MYLGKRLDLTDGRTQTILFCRLYTKTIASRSVTPEAYTALYCGAREQKHALTCLLFPMYPRNCAMIKRERKRLYKFLALCYLFPREHDSNCFLLSAAKLRIISRNFPKIKFSCLYKMLLYENINYLFAEQLLLQIMHII